MEQENIYSYIVKDSKTNDISDYILKIIKTYSVKNADKSYKPGEITSIVLNDLKKLIDKHQTNLEQDHWENLKHSTLLEIMLKKYLNEDPIFEIGLKI
jgi:hypothetical protein